MKMPRLLRPMAVGLLVLFLFPGAAAAQPASYDSFYAFGDSLADNGNVWITSKLLGIDPAPPPSKHPHLTYYKGRFSNGPVAFEYLWELISGNAPGSAGALKAYAAAPILGRTGAVDFAFGGTGTPFIDQTPGGLYAPGLKGQVELFRLGLRGQKPSKHALYAIVTGPNDYRVDQFNVPMDPQDVVRNIADSVRTLYSLGARDVMVLNMPDLGLLPGGGGPGSDESILSAIHNQLLAEALTALSAELPKLRLFQVDINQVFALLPEGMDRTTPALDAIFPPETLPPGFMMSLCLFINPITCADVPDFDVHSRFLFWDIVHPTTDVHRILAGYLYDALQQ